MSRDYARVAPEFWTGSTGRAIRALGGNHQVLAMYLLTSPHSTAIGLYTLPVAYVVADTGLDMRDVQSCFSGLRSVGFCDYDEAAEVVWVPEMARFQIGERVSEKDRRGPWIASTSAKFKKHRFYRRFVLKYREAFLLRVLDTDLPPETNPLRSIEGASKGVHTDQDQETEQETEQEHARGDALPCGEAAPPVGPKPKWLVHATGPDALTVRCLSAFDEGYATRSAGNRPLMVRDLYADLGSRVADASALGDAVALFREAGAALASRVVESRKTDRPIKNPWRVFVSEPLGSFLGQQSHLAADSGQADALAAAEARVIDLDAQIERLRGTDEVREVRRQREVALADLRRLRAGAAA